MAALLAAGITYFFSKKLNTRRAQHSSTQIVATTTELPSGMTLGAKDVAVVDWPSDFPLQGSYTKVEDVIGHPLLFSLGPPGRGGFGNRTLRPHSSRNACDRGALE